MRQSNGAFSHENILNLRFGEFFEYLLAFGFITREESEEGQKMNDRITRLKSSKKPIDQKKLAERKEILARLCRKEKSGKMKEDL